ncbi:hypothetical protein LDENG_00075430 [Lucifuga dentata]|nr:hypothetical protein LDENG_00075430 [Lucifuga dentata]
MQWALFFICLTGTTLLVNCENTPENVASKGITCQSSNYCHLFSSRAVDGNETLCAHTDKEENPWWMIDLLGIYNITSVTIFNKIGAINDAVLNGAEIHIGNSRGQNGITNQKYSLHL